jgi:cell division protein FtsX
VAAFALFVSLSAAVVGAGSTAAVAAPEEVDSLGIRATHVEVFMQVRATRRQIVAVQRSIGESSHVRRYAHLDKQAAYREFQRLFRRHQDLVASVHVSDLPESFRVELRHERDAKGFARAMRPRTGVESAVLTGEIPSEAELVNTIKHCQARGDIDVEVFMRLDATTDDVDAVVAAVMTQPNLHVTQILSQDDAYAEFRKIFARNAELLNSIGPTDLPRSVRIHADSEVSDAEIDALSAVPGVESVESPREVCLVIREQLALGFTPEELARAVRAHALAGAS